MKALVLQKPMEFSWEERPMPVCLPGQAVVKVDAVCVCGSDIHAIRGRNRMFTFPRVIGHEVAGTVYQVGEGVTSLQVGDKVCLMPCLGCGTCRACRKGKYNTCLTMRQPGVHLDGGLQEYLAAPADKWLKIPFAAKAEEISMVEPLTIGAHAVEKLALEPGDRVLVIGAGPIGLSCAVNAKSYGAETVLADTNGKRREFVRSRYGMTVLDPTQGDYEARLKELTDGDLFDAVVDTTACKPSMENAWRYLTQGGRAVFVGVSNEILELEGFGFHMREPGLFTTRNSVKKDYERVLALWQKGALEPGSFITHTVPFGQAAEALITWTDPEAGVFKGVVLFD